MAIKNGLILNDKTYKAVSCLATGLVPPETCTRCDLRRKCNALDICPCRIFNKKWHVVYFKAVTTEV